MAGSSAYNAFDENYYRIKASKPLTVGRVVRGKYSVPGAFDLAVDNGSLVERRSCTAHFKFNIRDYHPPLKRRMGLRHLVISGSGGTSKDLLAGAECASSMSPLTTASGAV
jgi:hypothetical protein